MAQELPKVIGWQFEVAEVAASLWEVTGHDSYGNTVRCVGGLEHCLRRCSDEASSYPRGGRIKRLTL